jgi:hypothetical protein
VPGTEWTCDYLQSVPEVSVAPDSRWSAEDEARKRAKALFDKSFPEFVDKRKFEVASKQVPGMVYRIDLDATEDLSVRFPDTDNTAAGWLCIDTNMSGAGYVPMYDVYLQKMLLAKYDEMQLWRIANLHVVFGSPEAAQKLQFVVARMNAKFYEPADIDRLANFAVGSDPQDVAERDYQLTVMSPWR